MNNSLFSLVEDLVKAEKSYKDINISGIKTDSKKVLPGDLFIAVNGPKEWAIEKKKKYVRL